MEYFLNRFVEVARQGDRERQGGRVALGLDRVDRLAGDVELVGEPLLGEAVFAADG
jgi:hypothetical protein